MIETMAAPEVRRSADPTKFERERAAFVRLRPELLTQYRGQFVAIHDEKVVGHGSNHQAVAFAAYEKFVYLPIYVDLIADEVQQPVRMPSFRVLAGG
ncbi:MAG: DUF5678 domain-containing protein [Planctomycetota bacterium]